MPADGGAVLLVRGARVAHVVELGRGREHRATKPHGEALHVVRDDVDLDGHGLELASAQPLAVVDALVDHALDVALPPSGWGLG